MITASSRLWLRLHMHYRVNILPVSGGIMQQPNKYIEAMEVLTSTFNGIERSQLEEKRREH
jgi:hypothetical protein